MIFSKQPQRDNIEIMLARKCGFYIRGKQQGLAEDEISMPILMTQTLHEMLVHFADEVRTITKAVYGVEIEQSQKEIAEKDELLDEQKCAIKGLNMCIGGEDSLTTNNLRACGEYLDNEKCLLEMVRELQAREKVLVEAISSSLNCIRGEINLNNYTETLLGDFISDYGDMVIILQYALANVRGEVK